MTDPENQPLNVDELLINADWPKRTWDLSQDPDEAIGIILAQTTSFCQQQHVVTHFLQTPSGKAMPSSVRKRLEELGFSLEVPDVDDTNA